MQYFTLNVINENLEPNTQKVINPLITLNVTNNTEVSIQSCSRCRYSLEIVHFQSGKNNVLCKTCSFCGEKLNNIVNLVSVFMGLEKADVKIVAVVRYVNIIV